MANIVIVGAGTAGCVLAERLTASGLHEVTLVEAGTKPRSPFVAMPAGFPRLFKGAHDWAFDSEPQTSAHGRRVFTPRGKMLGGSAGMNGQIHQWCHPADFDDWVAAGAEGWHWNDVAPVFRMQERVFGGPADEGRGTAGEMQVTTNPHVHPLSHAFVAAVQTAGTSLSGARYNGGPYEGAWITEIAHRDGRRFSVYDAFLKPAMTRRNLHVLSNAHVLSVSLDGLRANGVRARIRSQETTILADHVVLAAGAIDSPQLLMCSGIGPAAELTSLGIPVRVDASDVGANLQDHPTTAMVFRTRGTRTLSRAGTPLDLIRYALFGRGPLASNAIEAIAFARSTPELAAPDIELLIAPLEWRNQALEAPQVDAVSIAAAVVKPLSRGSVRLRSADPLAAPRIDFGLFSDVEGRDHGALLAAMRWVRRVAATAPLADFIEHEMRPGITHQDDDDLFERGCDDLQTVYHPTSTCRMGVDAAAVVDPALRVRGVAGLSIADASVMPTVPRGHPNAVVAMLAHRAAEAISAQLSRR